jgi:hypothetical protein
MSEPDRRTVLQSMSSLALASSLSDSALASESTSVLSYADIVARLYDLKQLAEPPALGERSGSWTSTDRQPIYNPTTGRYENWWGGGSDGSGCIRSEPDGAIVAAEIEGSGVIWRVWSAYPRQGHVKFFIDGSETPALDIPFADYFDNRKEPFNYQELTHVLSKGHNNYVPIAFQKSIKIVLERDWGRFYHFTYSTFPFGAVVPSFTGAFDPAQKRALARANQILARRHEEPARGNASDILSQEILVRAGETVRIADLRGSRAITSIAVTPRWTGDREQDIRILRELSLRIAWDEDRTPSVWAPLGDFFGTAPGINDYRALPMGMTPESFYSHWYMPFAESAGVDLTNDGHEPRRLRIIIAHVAEPRAARLLRFHAKWHRDDFSTRDAARFQSGDRWPDWPVLFADGGPGRFCGFHLHVWNPNPVGSRRATIPGGWGDFSPEVISFLDMLAQYRVWWGEGDEKFFVDGETYPSTFGTGSEDYFGYAYAAFHPDVFESAFQCQPLNRNNYGHISNVRFQIADNVPFQHSFEAAIEKYHPNAWPLLYAATAYWYQAASVADTYTPVPLGERLNYFVEVQRTTDVYEAEQLDVLRFDSGEVVFDAWSMQYSADHAIVWKNVAKPGDRLVLRLPVEQSGEFEVSVQLGRSVNAGAYRIRLGEIALGPEIDLGGGADTDQIDPPELRLFFQYSEYADELEEFALGRHSLSAGDHELSFEAIRTGHHGGFALPFDYIRLRKVQ